MIKTAIERAIKGGFEKAKNIFDQEGQIRATANPELFLLKPEFWQCLGKTEEWKETNDCWGCGYDEGETLNTPIWKVMMHLFIDWLIKNKSIDDFFTTILKK